MSTLITATVAFISGFTLAAILATGKRVTPPPWDDGSSYGGTE